MARVEMKRVRRSRSEWDEILARFEESDLSASAFCARESVSLVADDHQKPQLSGLPSAR